jgi:hypothetical protein
VSYETQDTNPPDGVSDSSAGGGQYPKWFDKPFGGETSTISVESLRAEPLTIRFDKLTTSPSKLVPSAVEGVEGQIQITKIQIRRRRTPANCLQGRASPPDGVADKIQNK